METMQAIFERRSVRAFTEKKLTNEQIESILRAGMYAPSARNTRTWAFITVTEPNTLLALKATAPNWKPLQSAPLCIAVCGYEESMLPENAESLVQNGAAATENMLLCIHDMGFGAVWLGINPQKPHYLPTKALLGIPEDVRVVALMAVGEPKEPPAQPAERYEPEKWHKERW